MGGTLASAAISNAYYPQSNSGDASAVTRIRSPICGKDFKTGQTLMKAILAPGFKARLVGVSGWYSTNILGNRDGEVLDDPGFFKTKEESKLGVLDYICNLNSSRSCIETSFIKCASTTIRRAAITKRRLGQHRYFWMARLCHADQKSTFSA